MELTELPLPPEIWAASPPGAQALIVALQDRIRELEARLGQNSSNSSRPPRRIAIGKRSPQGGANAYRLGIEWSQGAQIEHFNLDSFFGE